MRQGWMIGATLAFAWAISGQAPAATVSPTTPQARLSPKGPPSQAPSVVDQYNAAVDAFKADRCDQASALIASAIASPDFGALDQMSQSSAYVIAGFCAAGRKDWKTAYDDMVLASKYAEAPDVVFIERFRTAYVLDRDEDAVLALELAAQQRPKAIWDIESDTLAIFAHELDKHGDKALRARYLAALDLADYHPKEPFGDISPLWLEYAQARADAGDQAGAARVLGRISDPLTLTRAAVDRRFFTIIDADPQRFDVRAMLERQLAKDRADMAANPALLQGPIQVAIDLRGLGRPEEALALLEAAEPRLADKSTSDLEDRVNWYWDERSRTLQDLGRSDEAVATLKKGAAAVERGEPNVSQVLNLAEMLASGGQPEMALEAAKQADKVRSSISGYGLIVLANARACAYAQLGRRTELAETLAYVRGHEADNWGDATDAYLCAGDLDAAAAAFIRALADSKGRGEILTDLSEFDPAGHQTDFQRLVDERHHAVAKRPDVQSAVAKAGRVMRFHIVVAR